MVVWHRFNVLYHVLLTFNLKIMKTKIEELQEEILKLHNQKEKTGSEKHFEKCVDLLYDKERELSLLGGKSPLN